MSWQDNFTQYTTGFAFNLTLSRDMASLMEFIGNNEYENWQAASGRGSFIPTFRSLERRGLAEHNPMMAPGMGLPGNVRPKWVYRLTPAGQHVLELLRLTGVASSAPAPLSMQEGA
jgi:DNA-binding PadR family transcriptional regulator